ncbi:sigma-54 interaction domain-containing protein [Candidatus Nitrospira bockiana]
MDGIKTKKRCEEAVILDCISDGVVTIGLDMRVRYMNHAMRDLLGYEEGELLEAPLGCHLLVQSPICSTHDCILERAIRNREKVSNYETMIQNKDGRRIPVKLNTDLLWDDEGNLIGVVEVYRDVTQIKELKDKLEQESARGASGRLIVKSKALQSIMNLLPQVAASKATVLLEGESGTGKELIAREIHRLSKRRDRPFVAVNCAALAEGVLESELFGHVKGAFTGAVSDRIGRFEMAHEGTILLDEIAEMTPMTQAKLLRVLQEEEFQRVGGNKTIKVDVRVIAATNKDLNALVKEERFRDDLYYRLRVFPLKIPPLRERPDDILPLIEHCLSRLNRTMEKSVRDIDGPALHCLESYTYPGNVRELENILEHAYIRCPGHTIRLEHLPEYVTAEKGQSGALGSDLRITEEPKLLSLERQAIQGTLAKTGWNYSETCRILGISRSTLLRRLKEFGLSTKRKVRMERT